MKLTLSMLGHLGFSYIGLVYLLMLIIPNIIWSKNKPTESNFKNENKFLLILERVGQVYVIISALIFSDTNLKPFSLWSLWLIVSFIFMLMYDFWWIRYFKSQRTLKDFYQRFVGIPVAGATLPVLGFLFLGIYELILLILSSLVFGIGHIGIHLQHVREIKS